MTDHYFSRNPMVASAPSIVRVESDHGSFDLTTDTGVFSARSLDKGTKVLLSRLPLPEVDEDLLDLGCGYGPIALTLASIFPQRQVFATDVNTRALELTRENATRLKLENVVTSTPDAMDSERRFAAIYSNPPIKVGKKVLHEILAMWLPRLAVGGKAFLVVHKHLGSDSLAKWLTEQDFEVLRLASSGGFRVLQVGQSN